MIPANPYQAPGPMTGDQANLILLENRARHLFANDPTNAQLNDPHLLLVDVFNSEASFNYAPETPEEKRVPKLLTHYRQLDLTGSAIVDKPTFNKNWDEFTQGCLKGLDFTNVFVAGGAILGCLSSNQDGYRSSDIDLFLYGITDEAEANEKVRTIYKTIVTNTGGKGDIIRTARALTILCAYPYRHVQIILRLYRSPAEVLLGFDIDSCCVGYDGNNVFCQERFRRALTKRYNLVNISRRSTTYEQRLFKYSKRGFCVAVPDLDKARINTELFRKEIRDVSGLSKLILYDYKQGTGKSTFSRAPRKNQLAEGSDYNNDLPIPWGPEWQTDVIINILHAKNKANFFSALRKNKGQEAEKGDQKNATYNHMFTSTAAELAGGFDNWKRSIDGKPVAKPLEWIRDNPAYQDFDNGFQRLMTGSFEPVVDKNWETTSYLPNGQRIPDHILASKPFSTDESSIKDSNNSPTKQGQALPFKPVAAFPQPSQPFFPGAAKAKTTITAKKAPSKIAARPATQPFGGFGQPAATPAGFGFGQPTAAPGQKKPFKKSPMKKAAPAKMAPPAAFPPRATGGFGATTAFGASVGGAPGGFNQPSFGVPTAATPILSQVPFQPAAGAGPSGPGILSFGCDDPNAVLGPNPGAAAVFMSTPPGSPAPTAFNPGPAGFAPASAEFPTSPSFYDYRTNQALRDKRGATPKTHISGLGLGPQPGTASPSTFQYQTPVPSAIPVMPNVASLHQHMLNVQQAAPGGAWMGPGFPMPMHPHLMTAPLPALAPAPVRETTVTTKLLLLVALVFKKSLITSEEKGKLKDLVLSNNQLVFSALEVFEIDQDLDELTDTFRRICKFA